MQIKWLTIATIVLVAFIIVDVGCNGSSVQNIHSTPTPIIIFSPTPASAATTVPLTAGTALPIPPVAGFAGTFKEVGSVPAGATVKLTSYAGTPAGAPKPLALRRASSGASAPSVGSAIFLVSQQYSAPMTLPSFPSSTWQIPSTMGAGPFELETIDGTTGLLVDTESQASFSGGVATFAGNSATFSAIPSHIYWWELITGFPSPPPTGCGASVVSAGVNTAGQTIAEPDLCNFTWSLQTSANNAAANTTMHVEANVPVLSGLQGPPAPPGTTTGLLSVALEVNNPVTFNSGFLNLSTRLPSTIPAGGKSFFLSACTIHAQVVGTGALTYLGCQDTPYISGALPVAGQTLSFSGLPASLTLSGSAGFTFNAEGSSADSTDVCFKHCTPPPTHNYYIYTASIYY